MASDEASRDPVVREIRDEITEVDRAILAAVNRRVGLVARLKRHKEDCGYAFVDRGREDAMADLLAGENPGPVSEEGVRALYRELLALSKREVAGGRG